MAVWSEALLGDVCHVIGGGTPRKSNDAFYGGSIPWATVRDMKTDVISQTDFRITEDAVHASSTNIIPAGNVVIATRVGLGKVCLLEHDTAINQDLRGIVPMQPGLLHSHYLFYWFKLISPAIVSAGTGATVQGVKVNFVKSLRIPLPLLPEQERIAAILDEAFAAIATATANAEKNRANVQELFETHRNQAINGRNRGWPSAALEDVCQRFEYGTSAKSQPSGRVPVLRMGNIQDGEIDWSDLVYSSDPGEIQKYLLRPNDVLFNRTNSAEHVGKTAIFRGGRQAIFAGYLIRIHWDPDRLDPGYLNHFLNSRMARGHGKTVMGQSVNQANISGSKLKKYSVWLPPIDTQKSLVATLDAVKAQTSEAVSLYSRKLTLLAELKQSILHKAFTGDLTADSNAADRALTEAGL